MPHQYEHDHLIHPATLDAITQTLFGTMIKSKNLKTDGAQVPVNIGKLYIAADLPSGTGAKYVGYTHSRKKNPREYVGQIVMSDEAWSEPKIVYEDFVTMGLNQVMAGQASGPVVRKKCATVEWVQDVRYSAPTIAPLTASTSMDPSTLGEEWSPEVVELILRTLDELRDQRLPTEHLEHFFRWADASFGHLQLSEQASDSEVVEALDEFPERLGALVSSGKDISEALTEEFFAAFATSVEESAADHTALDAWLRMVYLNNPNASVLLLGDDSSSSAAYHVAKSHISRAGHTDCLQSCVIAEVNDDFMLRTKSALKSDKIQAQYAAFDPSKDPTIRGVDAQTFDLVIAPPSAAFTDLALANIKSVMSATGILLLSGSQQLLTPSNFISALSESWWSANMASLVNSEVIDEERWPARIQASGIQATVHTNVRAGNMTIGVVLQEATASLLSRHLDGRHVVLIQPEGAATASAAKFQEVLTEQLREANCTVAVARIGDLEAITGHMAICLAELSEDLIATMNEETFAALKDTVASASQLVWLTKAGVHLDGADSAVLNLNQTLATGLLRSIRSELARTVNIHLDISSQTDFTSPKTAQQVLHVVTNELFNLQVDGSAAIADHERELALQRDKVFVPRVTWDESFNLELAIPHRQDYASQEPLYQEDRILQYVVGTTGRLDSLHWVDDRFNPDYIKSNIAGDIWVEIKIMAWSLNFMDIMAAMGQIPTETLRLEIAGEVVRVEPGYTRLKPGMRVALSKKPSFITKILTKELKFDDQPNPRL